MGQGLFPQAHCQEIPEAQREDPESSPGQEAEQLPWDPSPFTSDFPRTVLPESSQGKDISYHGWKTTVHVLFPSAAKMPLVRENAWPGAWKAAAQPPEWT